MDFCQLHIREILAVVRYTPSSPRWTTENRKDHIIGIQLRGTGLHDFGYQKFVISRNDIYFLNRKDDYQVQVLEPCESFSIHFTTFEEIDTPSFCIPSVTPDRFLSILTKAETTVHTHDHLSLLSLCYRFCAEMETSRTRLYTSTDPRILTAKEYMDVHFKENDCLTQAITASNLSQRRFGELFRLTYNVTPNRYIVLQKIKLAQQLLSLKTISVTDTAFLCGYSDVYYFSKVFKEETGISPSKWKKFG